MRVVQICTCCCQNCARGYCQDCARGCCQALPVADAEATPGQKPVGACYLSETNLWCCGDGPLCSSCKLLFPKVSFQGSIPIHDFPRGWQTIADLQLWEIRLEVEKPIWKRIDARYEASLSGQVSKTWSESHCLRGFSLGGMSRRDVQKW